MHFFRFSIVTNWSVRVTFFLVIQKSHDKSHTNNRRVVTESFPSQILEKHQCLSNPAPDLGTDYRINYSVLLQYQEE